MVQAGSVEQANIVGLFLTGSDGYDNTAGLLLTGKDGPFAFYCFIIYFNLYFFVGSGFALYTTGPSILNITNVTVTVQMFLSRS